MAESPLAHVRADAASAAWRHGPRAEGLLVRLVADEGRNPDMDVAATAASGLGWIGGEASRTPLLVRATQPSPVAWRRESAKEALLAVEARLGILGGVPRREGLWEGIPSHPSQTREPIALFWRLAQEGRLHGAALAMALVSPDVWTRRQALAASLEQETEPRDLDVLARWLDDPKLGVAKALWRFGAVAEPILLGSLDEGAAWSLQRIGSRASLEPLRRVASDQGTAPPLAYRAREAISVIEARLLGEPN